MKKISVILSVAILLSSCIKNDIPYPLVVAAIKSIEVPGASAVTVNEGAGTVLLTLRDTTDVRNVWVGNVVYSSDMVRESPALANSMHDLTSAKVVTLSTYQDYKWVISAEQTIGRTFSVEKQVGSSVIDAVNHRVIARVPKTTLLSYVKVTECILEPEGITSYDKDMLAVTNFIKPVTVNVTCHNRTNEWTIYIEQADASVTMEPVEERDSDGKLISSTAWSKMVWFYATGIDGDERGFRYRRKGDSEWKDVPQSSIIYKAGDFSGSAEGLEPHTTYECLAFDGTDTTPIQEFTTQDVQDVPNGGFEVYSHAEDSKYWSLYDPKHTLWNSKWWDSGNKGSTSVGETAQICTPDTEDKKEGNASIRLNSRYVVVKFAAGNCFSGEFAGVIGTSGGKVNFGRPFTLRPRKLTLWLKYEPGKVDQYNGAPAGDPVKIGDMDRCQVYVALGTWDFRKYGGTQDSPVLVNTTDKSTFFDPHGPDVIGYGSFIADRSTDGWIHVDVPIDYVSTSRIPTHIIISSAASMLGDYFTGSSTSTLWLDDVRLEY